MQIELTRYHELQITVAPMTEEKLELLKTKVPSFGWHIQDGAGPQGAVLTRPWSSPTLVGDMVKLIESTRDLSEWLSTERFRFEQPVGVQDVKTKQSLH